MSFLEAFVVIVLVAIVIFQAAIFYTAINLEETLKKFSQELLAIELEFSNTKSNLSNLERSLTETKNAQENLRNQLNSLNSNFLSFVEMERRERITYPTYKELSDFVEEDKTELLEYSENFICTDFSNTFIKNFREKGFYSCLLIIDFEENKSHALVEVKTKDRGMVYVEPQSDKIIFNLKEGDDYCDEVNWYCDWVIKKIHHCA